MLLEFMPQLKGNKIVALINKFLYSRLYIALIGLLVLLCNIFSFEIAYFYIAVSLGAIIPCLLCEDYLPAVAPISMTYVSISYKSNNVSLGTSLFGGGKVVHLFVLLGLIVLFIIPKLIYDIVKHKERRVRPALWLGYLLLLPCYVLGGLFSPYYDGKTAIFGFVNFLSISGVYFVLLYAINWKNVRKDYFFWLMMTLGLVVAVETLFMYIATALGSPFYHEIESNSIYTGWGIRNNIAFVMCICVAAPLYLAIKSKKLSWLYVLTSGFLVSCCFLTASRGGFFTSVLVFIAGLVILFIKSHKIQRISAGIVLGVLFIGALLFFLLGRNIVDYAFPRFFAPDELIALNGRDFDWDGGARHFLENKIFGVGFYQCQSYQFENFSTGFMPPRYHNIYIQLLASTGLLGLCAYLFHRYETLRMTFTKPTLEKTFIYLTVIAIVATSLVDNHFFNMGPGLNYCVALAFIEGLNIKTKNEESITS